MKTLTKSTKATLNTDCRLTGRIKSVSLILLPSLFLLTTLLITSSCGHKKTSEYNVAPEDLHNALTKGLKVTGTATVSSYTDYIGLSYSTYQRWIIHLVVTDSTDYELKLGKDLFLIESNPEASIFDGITYCKGQDRDENNSEESSASAKVGIISNPLDNYELHYTDGGYYKMQGSYYTYTINNNMSRRKYKASDKDDLDFGKISSNGNKTIDLTLDEGIWLQPDILASVRIVLPEIDVITAKGKERFRLTAFLTRPNADSATWNVTRGELTHFQSDELAKTLENTEVNTITQVFAANWLTEIDTAKAAPAIAKLCQPLKQGMILGTGIELLSEMKSPLLAEHALNLFQDKKSPNGIRSRSGVYLGKVKYQPALSTLLESTNDKEEIIANSAVKGLGYFGGSKAYETLSNLMLKKKDYSNANTIAEALINTGESAAVPFLQMLVTGGNDASLNALIDSKRPECYGYFKSLLNDGKHKEMRDRLITGMKNSGGVKALPDFIDILSSEPQPDENNLYASVLVKSIITLKPDQYKQKLTDMANKGNLRAIQVFEGWDNPYAQTVLLGIAKNGTGLAQRIAFNGISENWPNESRDLLFTMLHNKNSQLVCSAIRGLQNTEDSTMVDSLIGFFGNSDPAIKEAASDAIGELGPGKQAPAILKIILTTKEYNTCITLVNALIEHNWKDKTAIKPLATRLKSVKGEMTFPIIRLLRHLSDNAMGPDGYSEWYDKQESWSKKWCDWAAKQ